MRSRIALVFSTFLQERTAVRVVGMLRARGLALPRRDRDGDTVWRAPTIAAVTTILRNPAYAGAVRPELPDAHHTWVLAT